MDVLTWARRSEEELKRVVLTQAQRGQGRGLYLPVRPFGPRQRLGPELRVRHQPRPGIRDISAPARRIRPAGHRLNRVKSLLKGLAKRQPRRRAFAVEGQSVRDQEILRGLPSGLLGDLRFALAPHIGGMGPLVGLDVHETALGVADGVELGPLGAAVVVLFIGMSPPLYGCVDTEIPYERIIVSIEGPAAALRVHLTKLK